MTINFPNNPGYGAGETSSYTYSSDGIVQSWYWGETGDNPVEAWIPDYSRTIGGGGGGGGSPQGPEGSVQFADSGSLSGISEVGVFSNNSLNPPKGLSANFLQYTESLSGDYAVKTTTENISVDFGLYNIYIIPNISLNESAVLTINGLNPATGSSLSLILGHTGASGSKIEIANMGVYWSDGPLNGGISGGIGYTANIYPNSSVKKFDVLYFFSDGTNIFGNHQRNYLQYK